MKPRVPSTVPCSAGSRLCTIIAQTDTTAEEECTSWPGRGRAHGGRSSWNSSRAGGVFQDSRDQRTTGGNHVNSGTEAMEWSSLVLRGNVGWQQRVLVGMKWEMQAERKTSTRSVSRAEQPDLCPMWDGTPKQKQ